ncbi:hypothetical protein [Parvicella tangerina]|uniref:Uncharacterized protein n=1 Tax=Parvicella tangerina TaxID=2829795 RepID=A0A916JLJ5_9FLAO|nr:hypothetical protein [Parvicella tangerina]CAG5080500.1 hypothetical protein CRYO30217_01344 [Parvicella tangerina]
MRRILLIVVFIQLVLTGFIAQDDISEVSHTYHYTVTKVISQEQLNEVVEAFESLKFVTKVKLNYKAEKQNMAQFIVYVSEPSRTSESQQMFEPTELKKIIIGHNLQPAELKIDDH